MKLRVKIWRTRNVVIAQVLEQDADLRGMGEIRLPGSTYFVESLGYPGINSDGLFIRGTVLEKDTLSACYAFSSEEDAILWCTNIIKIINKINDEPKTFDFIEVL